MCNEHVVGNKGRYGMCIYVWVFLRCAVSANFSVTYVAHTYKMITVIAGTENYPIW